MAEFSLIRIINNDDGVYTKDDLSTLNLEAPTTISVRWDDVAEDFTVYIGADELSAGPDITNYRTGLETFFEFCDGTTLNKFQLNGTTKLIYPYVEKIQVPNSAKCNAYVCDLRLTDVPLVTPDNGTGNGTIEVFATSTLNIEYSLNPFEYGDGQVSNVFTNLIASDYTVYIRDEYNCSLSVDVTVGEGAAYTLKYRAEFDGLSNGTNGKFEIYERNYSGSVEDIKLEGGLQIEWPELSLESFYESPIWPSSATLNIYVPESNEDKFEDMFTQDDRKYLGIYKRGTSEIWRGYITPALYQKGYFGPGHFTFVDGLESLKQIPMYNNGEIVKRGVIIPGVNDGQKLKGKISAINLIRFILNKLNFGINIKCGVNLYSQGMTTTLDPFQQCYIDADVFYQGDEAWNCYDALHYILKPFGARIHQYGGQWVIQRMEELGTTYNYRVFDSNGQHLTAQDGTESQTINYNTNATAARIANMADGNTEIMPAYGTVFVDNLMTKKKYLISNGGFEEGQDDDFEDWNVILAGNLIAVTAEETAKGRSLTMTNPIVVAASLTDNPFDAYALTRSNEVRYGPDDTGKFVFSFGFDKIDKAFPWVPVDYRVKMVRTGLTTLYLQSDGTFDTTDVTNRLYLSPQGTFREKAIEFEFPDTDIEQEATFEIRIHNSTMYATHYLNATVANIQAITTTSLPDGYGFMNVDTSISTRQFWELKVGPAPGTNTTETDITPTDYNVSTNRRYWQMIKQVTLTRAVNNRSLVIDDVNMEYLHVGLEPVEEETISHVNSGRIPEAFTTELKLGGLPVNETPNDRYMYLHQFTTLLGVPIDKWGRKDIDEAKKIQQIFLDMVANQHKTPSKKITGSFTAQESATTWGNQVTPSNVVYNQFDQKYYALTGLSLDDANWSANITMVEVKVNSDGSVPVYRAHSEAFSTAFS